MSFNEKILNLRTNFNSDSEFLEAVLHTMYGNKMTQQQKPIQNESSMDIRDKQLMIRKWIRENPEAFKKFLKEEYRYVYKMNKVSKKAAKVVTVIFTGIIIYGIYEALAMFLPFNLPRFLPQLQSILQG